MFIFVGPLGNSQLIHLGIICVCIVLDISIDSDMSIPFILTYLSFALHT